MDSLHVRNLEKYQPNYKDGRHLVWIRWDIHALRQREISMLTPAQRWLFISLIGIETHLENPVPMDINWLADEAKYPKNCISKDLNMLRELQLVVTKCDKDLEMLSQNVTNITEHNITKHIYGQKFPFGEVWDKYPRKVGRKAAEKSFTASVKTEQDFIDINAAIENYKKSSTVKSGFIQHGSRWFANWRDWVVNPEKEVVDVPEDLKPYIGQE